MGPYPLPCDQAKWARCSSSRTTKWAPTAGRAVSSSRRSAAEDSSADPTWAAKEARRRLKHPTVSAKATRVTSPAASQMTGTRAGSISWSPRATLCGRGSRPSPRANGAGGKAPP